MSGMSSIQKIDNNVTKLMQSQVTIKDVTDVVKELLENSVDSGATQITLRFKFAPFYQIWCKDDGHGIAPDDLKIIGGRSYSSKFNSSNLQDLKNVTTFGFRGEALHSIIQVSSKLEITTRPKEYNSTYKLSFVRGEKINEELIQLDESPLTTTHGTSILVSNVFGNIPVRLKQLEKIPESTIINKIRNIVFAISVTNPKIKLKIFKVDKLNHESLITVTGGFHFNNTRAISENLKAVYGISVMGNYESFEANYDNYNVRGIILLKSLHGKSNQFVFINRRKVENIELYKFINELFTISGFNEQDEILMLNFSKNQLSPKKGKSPTKLVGKSFTRHPVFVFDFYCPPSLSDLIQDPSKMIYESKHLEVIKVIILRLLKRFFKNHGFNINIDVCLKRKKPHQSNLTGENRNHTKRPAMKLFVNTKTKVAKVSAMEVFGKASCSETVASSHHQIIDFRAFNFPKGERVSSQKHGILKHLCNQVEIAKVDVLEKKSEFFPGISSVQLQVSDLQKVSVIGQVDKKFILVRLSLQLGQSVLLVVDQHACDERIRVESLLKSFIEKTLLLKNDATETDDTDTAILTIEMEQTLKFHVTDVELELLKEYYPSFSVWGINYNVKSNEVQVTHIPNILAVKSLRNFHFMHDVILQHCYDLKDNRKLKIAGRVNCDWWRLMQFLPDLIIDLLNSKACRSAVMFGDELSKKECYEYISQLKHCNLPFQCAHGRPSIVPLIDLDNVS